MLRFILTAMLTLILARFVFWVARLLTSGARRGDGVEGAGQGRGTARESERRSARWGRPRARVDRSSAIDVPFTEIPPGGRRSSGAPEAAPDAAEPSRARSPHAEKP